MARLHGALPCLLRGAGATLRSFHPSSGAAPALGSVDSVVSSRSGLVFVQRCLFATDKKAEKKGDKKPAGQTPKRSQKKAPKPDASAEDVENIPDMPRDAWYDLFKKHVEASQTMREKGGRPPNKDTRTEEEKARDAEIAQKYSSFMKRLEREQQRDLKLKMQLRVEAVAAIPEGPLREHAQSRDTTELPLGVIRMPTATPPIPNYTPPPQTILYPKMGEEVIRDAMFKPLLDSVSSAAAQETPDDAPSKPSKRKKAPQNQ